ncbi:MAG: histidine--tRNA ligase [Sphingobacteriales bacterium]|uniref:histidine--tRNA ligase n=1 Tax=Hydrotalea flava TaxID=714549 RepID=UPI0008310145|nr:histidine--tRNA ligase [Hydrotalea flava]RTL50493.1 MAG: histidine--tRNA ligase [Sphingobacteriales bacterium]
MNKPTLPQGTRDFNATTIYKRNYIFNTIHQAFQLYGFEPLETPAMENLSTLMGKYGEEGDKLIFRILSNGDFSKETRIRALKMIDLLFSIKKENNDTYTKSAYDLLINTSNIDEIRAELDHLLQPNELSKHITERALRYDLTIPFARYVAMNYGQLTFPFKRYQIQPVWRADRPQKGRYREFYQCDADIVGSNSLMNEVELAHLYAHVFKMLNLPIVIKINHRKILAALADICGGADKLTDITVAIDKLDKIGIDKVKEELQQRNLSAAQIETIAHFLEIKGSNEEKIATLTNSIGKHPLGKEGIEALQFILNRQMPDNPLPLEIDVTLARGLNYYTGAIFEVKAIGFSIGSIGGGGRYDNLTELFGVPKVPGVGISFGVDRIYDVMEGLALFPKQLMKGSKVLFFNLGIEESVRAFALLQSLRAQNISGELYHEPAKFDKQFKYAEKKGIPVVIMLGNKELEENTCTVKQLATGTQETIAQADLINYIATIESGL